MDYLSIIKQPIQKDLDDFIALFQSALSHDDGMLGSALSHIRQRGGKRMRPILMLLMARNFGDISAVTQHSAVGLELLHTASLVHDDVVDESGERRGQASVNATYNNKVAVLVGTRVFLCADSSSVRTFMALPNMALPSSCLTTSVSSATITLIPFSLKKFSSRAFDTLSPTGGNCMGSPIKIILPPLWRAANASKSLSKLPDPNSNNSF